VSKAFKSIQFERQMRQDLIMLRKIFSPLSKSFTLDEAIGLCGYDITRITCSRVYHNGDEKVLCVGSFKIEIADTLTNFYNFSSKILQKRKRND